MPDDVTPVIELHDVMGFRMKQGEIVLTEDLLQDAKELYFVHPRFTHLTADDQEAFNPTLIEGLAEAHSECRYVDANRAPVRPHGKLRRPMLAVSLGQLGFML